MPNCAEAQELANYAERWNRLVRFRWLFVHEPVFGGAGWSPLHDPSGSNAASRVGDVSSVASAP